jgi:hypothetical protein
MGFFAVASRWVAPKSLRNKLLRRGNVELVTINGVDVETSNLVSFRFDLRELSAKNFLEKRIRDLIAKLREGAFGRRLR